MLPRTSRLKHTVALRSNTRYHTLVHEYPLVTTHEKGWNETTSSMSYKARYTCSKTEYVAVVVDLPAKNPNCQRQKTNLLDITLALKLLPTEIGVLQPSAFERNHSWGVGLPGAAKPRLYSIGSSSVIQWSDCD
ncbi:hypothetical protein Trydic_g11664 [Trypoxylus dichotomus]